MKPGKFQCPYCARTATVDMTGEGTASFGLVVCDHCAGYVARHEGQWLNLTYEEISDIATNAPQMLAQIEAKRIELVERWLSGEVLPPTPFAAALTSMAREKGIQVCRWRPPAQEPNA